VASTPTPFPTSVPSSATHHVLEAMTGWNFNWQAIKEVLGAYESSLYWLAIVMVAIFILGTQLVFFPLCYRVMKMQATTAMRLSYLFSLFVTVVVFHWWLWHWIFFAMTKNYWVWLFWCLFSLGWIALIVWTPKRRLEA
jgi:hypothetical protein